MLKDAVLTDVSSAGDTGLYMEARPMLVQCLLRHAMAEAISEGFINCLIVTSVADANIQLARIHEHLFARKLFRDVYSFPHNPYRSSKTPENKCL
jgi:hypothetical protein